LIPDTVAKLFGASGTRRTAVPDTARIDVRIEGGKQDGETRKILVALGDRFCGTARTTDLEENNVANTFSLVLAEDCLGTVGKRELRVFVVDAFGNLGEIPLDKLPADRVIADVAGLIGGLKATTGQQRRMTLPALQELGVTIPDTLTSGGELASPWGDFVVSEDGSRWVLDLYSTSENDCAALLLRANQIEGVSRLAASAALADEMEVPATPEHIKRACANATSGLVRIIVPSRRQPQRQVSPPEVVEALSQFVGALKQTRMKVSGPIELEALQQARVAVPSALMTENHLSLPWGAIKVQKDGKRWVIDLYSVPKPVCTAVLLGSNGIPGVAKVATTASSKDETNTPVGADFAEQNCGDSQAIIRIMTTDDSGETTEN